MTQTTTAREDQDNALSRATPGVELSHTVEDAPIDTDPLDTVPPQ